jgi:hypothetical protein
MKGNSDPDRGISKKNAKKKKTLTASFQSTLNYGMVTTECTQVIPKGGNLWPNGDLLQMDALVPRGRGPGRRSEENHRFLHVNTHSASQNACRPRKSRAQFGRASDNSQQQQDDHNQNDQADAAAAIVSDARSEAVATKSKNQKQNNQDNQQHTFSFAARLLRIDPS